MNKKRIVCVLVVLMLGNISLAQEDFQGIVSQVFFTRISDRAFDLDFQGVGARTLGMGRTGIAAANDLSAIYWNPANSTNLLNPQATVHIRMNLDQREFTSPKNSGINVASEINPAFSMHFLAAAYPITLGKRRLVISAAFQNLNNMNRRIKDMHYTYGGGIDKEEKKITGGLMVFSPSLAFDLIPQISIGATYNYLFGDSDFRLILGSPYADNTVYFEFKDKEEYSGSYFDVGVTLTPVKWLSIGLVTTPSWEFSIKEMNEWLRIINYTSTAAGINYDIYDTPDDSLTEYTISIPLNYGIGLTLQPLHNITLAADYCVKPWSKAELMADAQTFEQELVDQEILRLGMEWRLSTGVWHMPLRFGYYTTPTPYRNKWFQDHYEGDRIEGEAWTFGVGFIRGKIAVEFAFERGSHEVGWWMDAGDYYNGRMFTTKDIFNRLTFSFSYKL